MDQQSQLSRRERQIMEVVFARGAATATEVRAAMADPPTRTAVRTFLKILEGKGYLQHETRGREFVFRPTQPRRRVGQSALRGLLNTFFDGSLENAVAAHLTDPETRPSPEELKRLARLISEARKKEN